MQIPSKLRSAMGTNLWAPLSAFEHYERPQDDGFSPVDTQAVDLSTFLRGEVQRVRGESSRDKAAVGAVMLPDGTPAQLTETATGEWELMVHVKRDWCKVYKARMRDEV